MNDNPYFEREADIVRTQGNLPHWSQTAKLYFVTFRLRDSLPEYVLERFRAYCEWRERVIELHGYVPEEKAAFEIDKHNRMMEYLDVGHGECLLRDMNARDILSDCIKQMDGRDCRVHCFVIMPNHVHMILETGDGVKVSDLVGRLKSISAHMINKSWGRKGSLWQYEIFDRLIRSAKYYWSAVRYLARNPLRCPAGTFTLVLSEEHKKSLGMGES